MDLSGYVGLLLRDALNFHNHAGVSIDSDKTALLGDMFGLLGYDCDDRFNKLGRVMTLKPGSGYNPEARVLRGLHRRGHRLDGHMV